MLIKVGHTEMLLLKIQLIPSEEIICGVKLTLDVSHDLTAHNVHCDIPIAPLRQAPPRQRSLFTIEEEC